MVKRVGFGGSRVELRPIELGLQEPVDDAAFAEVTITKKRDGHVHLREIEFLPEAANLP